MLKNEIDHAIQYFGKLLEDRHWHRLHDEINEVVLKSYMLNFNLLMLCSKLGSDFSNVSFLYLDDTRIVVGTLTKDENSQVFQIWSTMALNHIDSHVGL